MYEVFLAIFLIIAISIIVLIMLQQCKGSSFIGSFSAKLFSSSGSSNFMTRTTAILITLFFIISLVLANISNKNNKKSKWENLSETEKSSHIQSVGSSKIDVNDIPK